jgi:hypothetical protein
MKKRYIFKVLVEPQKALSRAVHIVCLKNFDSLHYANCYDMQKNVVNELSALGFKRVKYESGILSASRSELC